MEESESPRSAIKEAKEKLIIAVALYNNTLYAERKSMDSASSTFWFCFIMVFMSYPTGPKSDWGGFIVCSLFFGLFLIGFFSKLWRISCAVDTPLLENPEQAATYRWSKVSDTKPISLSPFLNHDTSDKVMENLYNTVVTDEIRTDRVQVVKVLQEAGLRHLMVDSIICNSTSVSLYSDDTTFTHTYYHNINHDDYDEWIPESDEDDD